MRTLETLADTLYRNRTAKGLDQKDMKMLIGMTQQQYQRIENGQDLRVSTLIRILEGLDLELILVPRTVANPLEDLLARGVDLEQLLADVTQSNAHHETNRPWAALLDELSDDD